MAVDQRELAEPPAIEARPQPAPFVRRRIELHGHALCYRIAGTGPAVVLVHGMVNASRHWERVAEALSDRFTVIAPDLLGHGDSSKPEADYSLGAHASLIRDLVVLLGFERATIVGHSLGGGIAMQFYYQFPERCERFAVVSSGGLGREVSTPLRLLAVPGAGPAVALAASRPVVGALERTGRTLRRLGLRAGASLVAAARSLRPLGEPGARAAFLHTLRAVIGPRGQRVSAADKLYLGAGVPTLIAWGERDRTIPPEHGRRAHGELPGSRLALLPGVGHFPHLEAPELLAAELRRFLLDTPPSRLEAADWPRLLRNGSPPLG